MNDRTGGIMYGEAGLIFQDPKQTFGPHLETDKI